MIFAIHACPLSWPPSHFPPCPFLQAVTEHRLWVPCVNSHSERPQLSPVVQSCLTLCDSMDCSTPGLPVHHQLPEFTQTHVHWVDNTIQPSHTLSFPYPPAFNLSQHQGLFKWVGSSHQMTKILEFQLQHQSFQWTPSPLGWTGWISLQSKGLLQHHSSKASILRHSAFFTVQLSHPYMTTGKTIALTRRTFVGKVMSLLFNMLSGLAISFLPKSKCLLISWLQSPSAVNLEPKKTERPSKWKWTC